MLNQLNFTEMKKSTIQTRTRSVKQGYRVFTDEQRKEIITKIDNRPPDISIEKMFEQFGFGKSGSVYYNWKKKFGMKVLGRKSTVSMTRPMNVPMNVKGVRRIHTVTLSVEVGSLMELIGFCTNILKTPKVKSVLSVE
jgi:hypothetical protein